VVKKLPNLKNIDGQIVDQPLLDKMAECDTEPPIPEKKK
jgi:hypothetical protein